MDITLIGIDCAVNPRKVGLALAVSSGSKTHLLRAEVGTHNSPVAQAVASWIPADGSVLLALDAPLGWPAPLAGKLHSHQAGDPVEEDPNIFFRRNTDRVVKEKIGKQSLDVGADRIARTAHAALSLLEELRRLTGLPVPLAWSHRPESPLCAIEVYPAATLVAHKLPSSGYKAKEDASGIRKIIVSSLHTKIDLQGLAPELIANADVLDAVVCILAALDFLSGEVIAPTEPDLARKEGWIWVRPRL